VSFEALFWPWLYGASQITITDPYIRLFHQARNRQEFRRVKGFEIAWMRIRGEQSE